VAAETRGRWRGALGGRREAGRRRPRRRLLAPEVVQTSAMDCGPAVLASLLRGFLVPADYGRLREACQTEVDGTSIDQVEAVARRAGLEAEQVMIPLDHVPLPEARALPAVLVTRRPAGAAHFVVVWRRWGRWLEVMDPAVGRRLVRWSRLRDEVLVHEHRVRAADWRAWAGSDDLLGPLRRRLRRLGLTPSAAEGLCSEACSDPSWRSLASLDAATRLIAALVEQGVLRTGRQARRALTGAWRRAAVDAQAVPEGYWSVTKAPVGPRGEEQLDLHGAVLVRVVGRLAAESIDGRTADPGPADAITAALGVEETSPAREVLTHLLSNGPTPLLAALGAIVLAASGRVAEALVFRGLLSGDILLAHGLTRLGALGAAVALVALLAALELQLATCLLRLGRQLETRLRLALLSRLPWIGGRFFQSRLTSDMAERCHTVHLLRGLPPLAGAWLRTVLQLALTTVGVIWLAPESTVLAVGAAVSALLLPAAAAPLLAERELGVRVHVAALSRFFLDAVLGLIAVRVHGGERVLSLVHDMRLGDWARARLELQRIAVLVDGLVLGVGFGLAGWLLLRELGTGHDWGSVLLLAYWALSLPLLGRQAAALARQFPLHRSLVRRIQELLLAGTGPDRRAAGPVPRSGRSPRPTPVGVEIELAQVRVSAGGHTILQDLSLRLDAGEHIAVLGHSGAGKSTLLGLLLGWHAPSAGRLLVEGEPLDRPGLDSLRRRTAWVDPDVRLFNRPLLDNIQYGSPPGVSRRLGEILRLADLEELLQRLPQGLQTLLGEGGGLLSGGEGQRVRLARALARPGARLVLLDESWRGLDRARRKELLSAVRAWWESATLLYVTHSPTEALAFDRAIVLERGRLVEDGRPAELAAIEGSRLGQLLEGERRLEQVVSAAAGWKRMSLVDGRLSANRPSGAGT